MRSEELRSPRQPFDLAFHPSEPVVYVSLLTGEVKAFRYDDEEGEASTSWTVRPTKRTARALDVGDSLWMGGKSGALLSVLPFGNDRLRSSRQSDDSGPRDDQSGARKSARVSHRLPPTSWIFNVAGLRSTVYAASTRIWLPVVTTMG